VVLRVNDIDPTVPSGPIAYTADQRANWEATIARTDRLQARLDEGPFMRLAGGQMRGPLFLNADPLDLTEAATKRYVDVLIGIGGPYMPDAPRDGFAYGRSNGFWGEVLPLTGGRLTGSLLLAADPTLAAGAATKRYVDARVSAIPEAPIDGGAYGRINGFWGEVLPLTGCNLGGPLVLATEPTSPNEAVTKGYVDARVSNLPEAPIDTAFYGRANEAWKPVLGLAGGRMIGPLILAADPANAPEAATKRYVDAQFSAGGFPDAPVDGVLYGRQDAAWAAVPPPGTGGGGIPDAPADGVLYGRQDAAWTAVPPPGTGGGGIPDAPADGVLYGRQDAAWAPIPPGGFVEPIGPGTFGRLQTGTWARTVVVEGDVMTGPLQVPDGIPARVSLAVGEPTTGFYRSPAQGLIATHEGTGVMLFNRGGSMLVTDLSMQGRRITGLSEPTDPGDAASKEYVDSQGADLPTLDARYVRMIGDTMTGPLQVPDGMPNVVSLAVGEPTTGFYRSPAQGLIATHENVGVMLFGRAGSILATDLSMAGRRITNLDAPTDPGDAASKGYVDAQGADLPTLDARYVRMIGDTMTGLLTFQGQSLGILWDQGATIYHGPNGLVIRRDAADNPVTIEGSGGLPSTRFPILTTDTGVRKTGDTMSGPLNVPDGTVTVPGLGLGAADGTGLSRSLSAILLCVQGAPLVAFSAGAIPAVQFYQPLFVLNNRIQQIGDATAAGDALNLRTGDARYLQLATGGSVRGDIQLIAASGIDGEIGIDLGGRFARIYWGNGIVLRRGGGGESAFIENNNGSNRSEIITQQLGDTRYLQLAGGGIVAGPVQILTTPVIGNDAANKTYVDQAVAAAVAPTAFRTFAFTPNDFTIAAPSAATPFLDVNVTLPGGPRNILISIDPVFASNDPQGTMWELFYSTDLIALESSVVAYKITNNTAAFFRSSAKLAAAVDASAGSVRVILRVRCTTLGSPLIQVGNGGTLAPTMRTFVTVQDLGPV